ncbi:hypothetical protein MLD38_023869 [Melastoma candidum]|uniref:Uncharacterized protein n=1 Tax=Melastoma candidum TaxID=119954 RepID=A0ACB9NQL5_9MYRT|nr:hypothetical protein MLD38_023869 [Melastoma candidum]
MAVQTRTTTTSLLVLKTLLLAVFCLFSFLIGSSSFTSSSSSIPTSTFTHFSSPCEPNSNSNSTSTSTSTSFPPPPPPPTTTTTTTPASADLDFYPHHQLPSTLSPSSNSSPSSFPFCPRNFTNYSPCHDPSRELLFPTRRFFHRERHCPLTPDDKLRCLVRPSPGYRKTLPWPKSRDHAWFRNVPFTRLSVLKQSQNWVRVEGDRIFFPGGGTSFPTGAKSYVEMIKRVVPLRSGTVRTVLDIGCGVASFGAALMDYKILTMSVAPRDIHEAQVQFALERGLPAMLGILSTNRLPFPSRSFDMAHCSRCLVKWADSDGLYLIEIDRVLRPGGYWVLSGPPISWKNSYKGWQRSAEDLENEQNQLEDLARRLCWKKVAERGPIAVWRKPTNHVNCAKMMRAWKAPGFCVGSDPDAGWYKRMDACLTPLSEVKDIHDTSGGAVEKWPKRLNAIPPRIRSGLVQGIMAQTFSDDTQLWKKRVSQYRVIVGSFTDGRFRNVMDMNAGLGGFAAALGNYPVWVMNAIPHDLKSDTLGIIYERGLIGTYMNWCEAFSTYPRTYDMIHADGIFTMYQDKCDAVDILIEIYRILRPEGVLIGLSWGEWPLSSRKDTPCGQLSAVNIGSCFRSRIFQSFRQTFFTTSEPGRKWNPKPKY